MLLGVVSDHWLAGPLPLISQTQRLTKVCEKQRPPTSVLSSARKTMLMGVVDDGLVKTWSLRLTDVRREVRR